MSRLNSQIAGSQIYVSVLIDGLACWRPIKATHLRDDIYRISRQPTDSEQWEFLPGEVVHCKQRTFGDGRTELVAFKKSDGN